jgi:hypothetical protein
MPAQTRQTGLFDRFRPFLDPPAVVPVAAPAEEPLELALRFVERQFDTYADDGTEIYGRGWVIHDSTTDRAFEEADPLLDGASILIFNVRGVTFRKGALQQPCFNPGHKVLIVPEPDNPVDKDALAVWDASRRHHLGYVPKERTWRFRISLGANRDSRAYVWWDWHKTNGERCGVKVVLLPYPAALEPMPDWRPTRP